MVLESLINPIRAEKQPWKMFFVGILYSSVAVIVSLYLFPGYAGLVMIFFTVAASIPLIYLTIKHEEEKDMHIHNERLLIKEHGKALSFFIFLFLGFVVSFSVWYMLLPSGTAASVFEIQTSTINSVNSISGNFHNIGNAFVNILLNNFRVLAFCLIFAFFYGFGAIFILTWNASVIAVAIGSLIKSQTGSLIGIVPFAFLRYFVHGIPEILAYFMAGLAGGIISIAVIRHDYNSPNFRHILLDSIDLVFGSVIVLVLAALLEVFVTPLLF